MTTPAGGAERPMVLAWMREMGKGYKAAAAHFGLPVERVKMWERRASPRPPAAPSGASKVTDEARVETTRGGPSGARARAHDRPPTAEAIGPELRRTLRRGVTGLSRFVALAGDAVPEDLTDPAKLGRIPDMQQVAHAARALDILIARVPELMTFEEATTPASDAGNVDVVNDRVRASLARRHAEPAPAAEGLRLVKTEAS